ncbi:MAG: MBL fold metallo-hydrolase [Armatimonadetes bacterium]|nr:MAG: MBL fold metallo-hydrolase [Armatimonadota bacterium]
MAEAIVLGSGTSNGVPMLGVRYSDSFLADPRNHRTRPSLLLSGPSGNVLVDCSPEMRLQLLRERVIDIEAVIVTHTHADHIMGMDDLRSFCITQRRPMPIYTLPAYQDDIRRVFSYAFAEHADGIEVPRFDLRDVPPNLRLASLEIETFLVDHGSWPVVGIRVGGLAYLTDVNRIPSQARESLTGLDVLIMDAVRYRPHPNHFHFDQAVEEALSLGAKMTYFTHLSHDYDHARVEKELPPQIRLAYDGLRIPL